MLDCILYLTLSFILLLPRFLSFFCYGSLLSFLEKPLLLLLLFFLCLEDPFPFCDFFFCTNPILFLNSNFLGLLFLLFSDHLLLPNTHFFSLLCTLYRSLHCRLQILSCVFCYIRKYPVVRIISTLYHTSTNAETSIKVFELLH